MSAAISEITCVTVKTMTHYIKDKYESRWFREGQGKGPSAENKEEEKAKKKIPKKRAFSYSCIYTAGTQTHDRTYDRTQCLTDKIQNCSKGCLKLEADRSVCRAFFTSKRGALSSLVTRQLQTPTRRIKGDSRYHRANRSLRHADSEKLIDLTRREMKERFTKTVA